MAVPVKRNEGRAAETFGTSLSAFYACVRIGNVDDPALFSFVTRYKPLFDPVAEFLFKGRMKQLSELMSQFDVKNREKAARIAAEEVNAQAVISKARKGIKAGREPEKTRRAQDIWTFKGREFKRGWAIFCDLSNYVEVE
ncbi:hypothetical protein ABL345_004431 [Salmonella enterica subsp. enterica serovar Braenderup]|nr:hypothetical protein [Salmonella enterica]ECZ6006423.1 hypothetical protein [Salmonella enterica]